MSSEEYVRDLDEAMRLDRLTPMSVQLAYGLAQEVRAAGVSEVEMSPLPDQPGWYVITGGFPLYGPRTWEVVVRRLLPPDDA